MMTIGSWIRWECSSHVFQLVHGYDAVSGCGQPVGARALDVHDRLMVGQLAYAFRIFHPPCLQASGHVDGAPYQHAPAAVGQIGQGGGYGLIGLQRMLQRVQNARRGPLPAIHAARGTFVAAGDQIQRHDDDPLSRRQVDERVADVFDLRLHAFGPVQGVQKAGDFGRGGQDGKLVFDVGQTTVDFFQLLCHTPSYASSDAYEARKFPYKKGRSVNDETSDETTIIDIQSIERARQTSLKAERELPPSGAFGYKARPTEEFIDQLYDRIDAQAEQMAQLESRLKDANRFMTEQSEQFAQMRTRAQAAEQELQATRARAANPFKSLGDASQAMLDEARRAADAERQKAKTASDALMDDAKSHARELLSKAQEKVDEARTQAEGIRRDAERRAAESDKECKRRETAAQETERRAQESLGKVRAQLSELLKSLD